MMEVRAVARRVAPKEPRLDPEGQWVGVLIQLTATTSERKSVRGV